MSEIDELSVTDEEINRYLRHCARSDNPFRLLHEVRKLRREISCFHDLTDFEALRQRIRSVAEDATLDAAFDAATNTWTIDQ